MEQLEWSPRRAETAVTAACGLVLCAAAVATDTLGRFLALIAGLGLLAVAAGDILVRPRLRADPAGVASRTFTGRIELPWSQVEAIRVDQRRGVAVRSVLLEIDAGDTLIMLSRRALGADPREVADTLTDLRRATG
ncbi:MAG TPA: PH domain-containing protein [Mycobacteriales bacterium]|nr:PH domain-containing protein [Mycobacteriales bacterium]